MAKDFRFSVGIHAVKSRTALQDKVKRAGGQRVRRLCICPTTSVRRRRFRR